MKRSTLFVLVAVIAGAYCNAIPSNSEDPTRNGQFNVYSLYTRNNPLEPQVIRMTASSIRNSGFDASRDTAIIVHGHRETGNTGLNPSVKDAYLGAYDANVIIVDWDLFASQSYASAVAAVPSIGTHIGIFLELLREEGGLQYSRVHLIGFDLGAHAVGFAGRQVNGQVARITGLDPNGDRWGSSSGRLQEQDAVYVEVIHTDSGLLGNGIGTNIGRVNFHPNGGSSQPGCFFNACDHERAWELFTASLIYNHLLGRRCTGLQMALNSCNGDVLPMGNGELIKLGNRAGEYRVNTESRFPF